VADGTRRSTDLRAYERFTKLSTSTMNQRLLNAFVTRVSDHGRISGKSVLGILIQQLEGLTGSFSDILSGFAAID
jgi:hypothetical protein